MNLSAVIFDRDGVLTYFDIETASSFFQPLVPYSIFQLAKQWQLWGEKVGFPASPEEERAFFDSFWRELRRIHKLSDQQYRTLSACRYTDFIQPYPEVATVLQELKRRGVAIGVLSNFALATLDASLEAVGIRQWIDVACAATVIGDAKPQPEAYHTVANLLQIPPSVCLFLDDDSSCVAGAQAVGMTAYLVDRQSKNLEGAGVDRKAFDRAQGVVHDLTAALDLIF